MRESLVGSVPATWATTSLGELCAQGGGDIQTGPFGSQLHAADYVESGIPSVMPQNIGDNVIIEAGIARITREDASRLSRYALHAGDIVYSRRGDVERRALIRDENNGWLCGTGCLRIRLGAAASPRYISYYLGHPAVRAWIVRHAVGATMPNLNTKILGAVPVVVPPRADQEAIAEVLAALEDKIAINEHLIRCALSLADAHFARVVRREGREVTLGELSSMGAVSFGDGYRTKKSEHGQPGLPILRVAEVGDFDIFPAYEDFVSVEYRSAMNQKISRPGDVVLTTKGTVGRATIVPRDLAEFVYSPQVCYFRVGAGSTQVSAEFLYLWFRSRAFWDQASSRKGQTDMADYLSLAELRTLRIRALDEQSAADLQRFIGPLLRKAEACRGENRVLANLRDTLLPKLISGELRFKDAARLVSGAV